MKRLPVSILGTGKYLPSKKIYAAEMDERLGLAPGESFRMSGVEVRHYVDKESAAAMGASAVRMAMENARISVKDIDAIICVGAAPQQLIPCTAALLQKELGLETSGIPCFDVNSTCLGFITGLEVASSMISAGVYKKILLVAADISSIGMNWKEPESASLFGDGAAAAVVGETSEGLQSEIISYRMETFALCVGHNQPDIARH